MLVLMILCQMVESSQTPSKVTTLVATGEREVAHRCTGGLGWGNPIDVPRYVMHMTEWEGMLKMIVW